MEEMEKILSAFILAPVILANTLIYSPNFLNKDKLTLARDYVGCVYDSVEDIHNNPIKFFLEYDSRKNKCEEEYGLK